MNALIKLFSSIFSGKDTIQASSTDYKFALSSLLWLMPATDLSALTSTQYSMPRNVINIGGNVSTSIH